MHPSEAVTELEFDIHRRECSFITTRSQKARIGPGVDDTGLSR